MAQKGIQKASVGLPPRGPTITTQMEATTVEQVGPEWVIVAKRAAGTGDWKPTMLAVLLIIGFFIISAIPFLRDFFALTEMTPFEWALVCGTTIIWLFAVRFFWRHSITARFLGIKYA